MPKRFCFELSPSQGHNSEIAYYSVYTLKCRHQKATFMKTLRLNKLVSQQLYARCQPICTFFWAFLAPFTEAPKQKQNPPHSETLRNPLHRSLLSR